MKKNIFSMLLFFSSLTFAQIDITAGMGLNFFNAPDLKDYINSYSTAVDEMQSFNTSADFFGEIGYDINQNYQIAIEYTFNIYSFNSTGINGIYDLEVDQHKPSLIGYYVLPGNGYKVKIGLGVGIRKNFQDSQKRLITQLVVLVLWLRPKVIQNLAVIFML